MTPVSPGVEGDNTSSELISRALSSPGWQFLRITASLTEPDMLSSHHPSYLAENMKAELQELMNRLRKLQGSIDFGNAPMAEREELAGDVTDIMDMLFEVMKQLPDE